MKGNLIISKHNSFYTINNNLINVNIYGNKNKIVNQYNITRLFIHGNNNVVEIIKSGIIQKIKIFGNNNKIYLKNNSQPNYIDEGIENMLIKKNENFIVNDIQSKTNQSKDDKYKDCCEIKYELHYGDSAYYVEDCYYEVKLFGTHFVKENKDKCKIIYENEEYESKERLEDTDIDGDFYGLDSINLNY
jgi:hypothetical protein